MDLLQTMKVFLAVVDEGGFTAAARRMDMSVPNVTRLVASLESHLGARLLQRTTRSVSLTPAGSKYAARAREITESVDEAFSAVQDSTATLTGTLCVGASPEFAEYLLGPLVPAFMRAFPELTLDVQVEAASALDLGRYDVALLWNWQGMDPNIVARTLFTSEGILCAAPSYLAQHSALRQPEQLAQHRCLLRRSPRTRSGLVRLWRPEHDVAKDEPLELAVPAAMTVNHTATLLRAALGGAGIGAFAAEMAEEYLASGQLVQVLPDWITGRFSVLAAVPSRQHMPVRTKAFLDFLLEQRPFLKMDGRNDTLP